MIPKLSLEEGVEKIFELGKTKEKPVLVSIHGQVNCGKSYIVNLLTNMAFKKGFVVNGGMCENKRSYLDIPNPDYVFVEDAIYTAQAENCAREIVGKGIDIRVLVDNPRLTRGLEHYAPLLLADIRDNKYDVIIDNPDSKDKKC